MCKHCIILVKSNFIPGGNTPNKYWLVATGYISLKVDQYLTSLNSLKQNSAYFTKASIVSRFKKSPLSNKFLGVSK